MPLSRKKFQGIVEEAIASLPAAFRERLENVEVLIEAWPSDDQIASVGLDPDVDTLFGLYEGTPLPERGHDFAMTLPDRVTIFQGPLLEAFEDAAEIREEIRKTVVHEIAHFFGLDDDEIEDLGY